VIGLRLEGNLAIVVLLCCFHFT